jgi:hypothetical protein
VRAIGITHPVRIQATTNPTKFYYSPDPREQQMLLSAMNVAPMTEGAPTPMGNQGQTNPASPETTPDKKSKIQIIRRTQFKVQFIWQPIPEEEREVNDIIMSLVAPDLAAPNPDPNAKKAAPNLERPFSDIEQAVAKRNEEITAQNEANKMLPLDDPTRQLNKELLKVTQEQFDAFKKRFLTEGTPEESPAAVSASAAPAADGTM